MHQQPVYQNRMLTDRLKRYLEAGISAVELGARVQVQGSIPEVLDRAVGNLPVSLLIHNYFPPPTEPFVLNLASSDVAIRTRSINFVLDALVLSRRIGADFYSFHGGFITDPIGFGTTSFVFPLPESSAWAEAAMQRFCDAVTIIADRAAYLDLDILVENNVCPPDLRGKLLLQTTEEFQILLERVPAPHLGILLDTGHLNVSAHTFGFDPKFFVKTLANHIHALHLHDNDGQIDLHRPLNKTGWIADMLVVDGFARLPMIVEAQFQNVIDLSAHMAWLRDLVSPEPLVGADP